MTSLVFLTRNALLQQKRKLNEATESGDFRSVALRSPATISEYLSIMQARSFSKMSALELQDRQIPGTCVLRSLSEDTSWLTLSGRELHSGHDCMDGIEELGHVGRFYRPKCVVLVPPSLAQRAHLPNDSGSLASHTITAENQVIWGTHATLSYRGSFACCRCDPCPQEQNPAR